MSVKSFWVEKLFLNDLIGENFGNPFKKSYDGDKVSPKTCPVTSEEAQQSLLFACNTPWGNWIW